MKHNIRIRLADYTYRDVKKRGMSEVEIQGAISMLHQLHEKLGDDRVYISSVQDLASDVYYSGLVINCSESAIEVEHEEGANYVMFVDSMFMGEDNNLYARVHMVENDSPLEDYEDLQLAIIGF